MSYIIFFLVFYFIFSSLVIVGTMIGGEFKWYDYVLFAILFGWAFFPIFIGVRWQMKK